MDSASKHRIGRYEILAELGRGSMGVVYKARDPHLNRLVAIKTVRSEDGRRHDQHPEVQTRLYAEATAVARLNHPNIVAVYDVVIAGDAPCIVMEYVEGQTLGDLIAGGPLRPDRVVHMGLQVCEALHYAHGLGVVHRDIKSGNILLAEHWIAKLSDFGIARLSGRNATQTGVMMGTPASMAPEQVRGHVAEPRSDLFSLGVVLYEAVTGVSPFQGDDVVGVLFQVVHVDPVPPRQRNREVSPALDAVIRRAMSKDPDRRYPSARALAEALARTTDPRGLSAWNTRVVLAHLGVSWQRAAVIGGACLIIAGAASSDSDVRRATTVAEAVSVAATPSAEVMSGDTRPGQTGNGSVTGPATPGGERAATPRPGSHERTSRGTGLQGEAVTMGDPFPQRSRSVASVRTQVPESAASIDATGCLSVNAIPYASVYVDGRLLGETPWACLRVPVGEHRVHFQGSDDRSSERVIRVTNRHTAENPLRLSYDFGSRQFRER